jgi:hypothetical protein
LADIDWRPVSIFYFLKTVARTRTTKKLAQRIDLNYFKRPTPLKRAKFWLSLLLPLLTLVWIAWQGFLGDRRAFSSGRMSKAHAVLEKECGVCHLQKTGALSAKAADSACLGCHDGPIHHELSLIDKKELACAECHAEHRGRVNLSAASNQACAECHSDLKTNGNSTKFAPHIRSFADGHPEFAALLSVAGTTASDSGSIKLNHAIHMKPIRGGPNGPNVQLECGNCHRATAADADLEYADPKYRAASVRYKDSDEFLPAHAESLKPLRPATGRELIAPVKFANACAACHSLTFDKRFNYGVPHDKPEVVHAFLVRTFREYIAAHSNEVRVQRDPGRDLTGKPLPPAVRILTLAQWVTERTAETEDLLWRKTCKQCHTLTASAKSSRRKAGLSDAQLSDADKFSGVSTELPDVALANTTLHWMPHAKFDHGKHDGFTCVSCHAKALTSAEASDILLPGIATCKTCHAPGPEHAESRCFECHTYHDWSKRKEVAPRFTLPALAMGSR